METWALVADLMPPVSDIPFHRRLTQECSSKLCRLILSQDNVEKVIWEDIQSSTFTVIVQASGFTRLEGMEQGFAVVWDICPQSA